jgi:ribosomal protein L3 glutamine methyltransferase
MTDPGAMTVQQLMQQGAAQLEAASLCYGHGSDNASDEAAELVIFSLGLRHEDAPGIYSQPVSNEQVSSALALIQQRIDRRVPAAYLTHRMWFGGHEFYVDERVLVPRSPIAELIEMHFAPWIDADLIHRALDIGTGSGCIAIATALALPQVRVDAADVSADALAVAQINIEKHGLKERVRAIHSDVFDGLVGQRYDLIVSNPPYVSAAEVAALPNEYKHEPELGLLAGDDGLSIVRRILARAEKHLTPHGLLVVEVGDTEETLMNAYPRVPFTWLEFERGGGGVFVLTAAQLAESRKELRAPAAQAPR